MDERARAPRRGRAEATSAVWSVGELTREVARAVAALGRVAVEGEVSRVTRAASGHVYFDLKDLDARLSCKLWRSQVARALAGELREGDRVVARGKLDVYPPQGSYSLIVDRVEAAGLGALLAQLEALKAELKALGWFDRARPLPAYPRLVGVVTSRDGAALQDFLRTRSQRWPLYPVRFTHTPVQGPDAAREIARAIARLDASGVDVIVVCRGGGSLEDLWCFNERVVAEAIHASSVPVVCGVGHETDVTLADLVADARAHTPTDAAQRVLPDRRALVEALERAAWHLGQALDTRLEERHRRLERATAARVLRDPRWLHGDRAAALERAGRSLRVAGARRLEQARALVAELSRRVERTSPRRLFESRAGRLARAGLRGTALAAERLSRAERRAERCAAKLEALSPLAILGRGYSITYRVGSEAPLVTDAALRAGDELETRLARGRVRSRVSGSGPGPDEGRPGAG